MRLVYPDGGEFATGECAYISAPVSGSDAQRVFIPIKFGELPTQAAVDTGGSYVILDPELASALNLSGSGISDAVIRIRGIRYQGSLHRYSVTILSEEGHDIEVDATVFVPRTDEGEEWALPVYLGWFGFLERLKFAIDPSTDRFFFGPV